jgi:hypothetical protein
VPESGGGGGGVGAVIVIVTVVETVVVPSLTEIVETNVPAVVGVPDITPPRSVNPVGSAPLVIDQMFWPVPLRV